VQLHWIHRRRPSDVRFCLYSAPRALRSISQWLLERICTLSCLRIPTTVDVPGGAPVAVLTPEPSAERVQDEEAFVRTVADTTSRRRASGLGKSLHMCIIRRCTVESPRFRSNVVGPRGTGTPPGQECGGVVYIPFVPTTPPLSKPPPQRHQWRTTPTGLVLPFFKMEESDQAFTKSRISYPKRSSTSRTTSGSSADVHPWR
jgi:hypothetical protein